MNYKLPNDSSLYRLMSTNPNDAEKKSAKKKAELSFEESVAETTSNENEAASVTE